ncbi:mitogen-activated protein kinase organizer 1 [Microthyrium microscopicum]|uniref:Mitogen-activated protein kinase organizer 1 n=1 Tax=Microthyrium microscopicum TaxID=703497 RepID=A0A6A6ULM1_9PEZI|nr:mitogen-activated protein kinase organizer 1 [Microthyrium microscopicum]
MTQQTTGRTLPVTPVAILSGPNGPVHALTYSSAEAQYILTGSSDRLIRLYNPAKASLEPQPPGARPAGLIQTYAGHAHEVLDIAVSYDNARFASVGGDKNVILWDVAQATVLRRWEGHGGRCNAVAWAGSEDEGGVIISGSFDATVKMWDTKSNNSKPLMTLSDAKDSISCLAVVDAEIFVGSVDGRVRVYDIRMGKTSTDVIGNSVTSITPTRKGDAYLVSTLDSTLLLIDKSSGKMLQSFTSPKFSNTSYRLRSALAANDSLVVSGSEDGRIIVWDILAGVVMHELWHDERFQDGPASKKSVVSGVQECPVRDEWCSAAGDGTVVVWGNRPED